MPTQKEYNSVFFKNRKEKIRIEILNENFQVLDEIQGSVVSQPNFTNSSSSDIRRSCDIAMQSLENKYPIQEGSRVWADKYMSIYKGIEDYDETDIWTKMGTYVIDNPSQIYSGSQDSISIQGVDLMCKLNGYRNGNLEAIEYLIPQGTNIREAIIAVIKEAGFNNYIVEEVPVKIDGVLGYKTPYDITEGIGGTYYGILVQLRDIVPNYEMYFDVDGVFHFNQIPNGENEQVMATSEVFRELIIDSNISIDYSKIYNSIEVLGGSHDIKNFATEVLNSGNTYNVTIPSMASIYDYSLIGFVTNVEISNPNVNINNLGIKDILDDGGNTPTMLKDKYYALRFNEEIDKFILLGEVQPYAKIEETNPDSPFYVNGELGRIRKVFQGGEYDNITSDYLAMERAKFELYNCARLHDSITFSCVPIYWLDVNWVIEVNLPKVGIDRYIIKEISIGDIQSITCMKYYPFYPST